MVTYAQQTDLEQLFGKDNIRGWADVNNRDANFDVKTRIEWALKMTQSELDDKLRRGPYAVPFRCPPPNTVVYIHTLMAGVLLYESRGVTDAEDGTHQLQWHRKKADAMIRDILARRIKLDLATQAAEIPQAVSLDDDEATTDSTGAIPFE